MTGPYGFWWTLCVVILCAAAWQTGRAIFRHGQSQPDQARHPSAMPDLDGTAMPWPPPRSLLYVRPATDGFEMACDCGQLTHVTLTLDRPGPVEFAVTCGGCGTSHWILFTPTREQA